MKRSKLYRDLRYFLTTRYVNQQVKLPPDEIFRVHFPTFVAKGFETMLSGQSGKVVLDWD